MGNRTTSLDHCVIHVSDWEKAVDFYTRVIGAAAIPAQGGGRVRIQVTGSNLSEQGCSGEQLHKRSPASVPDGHHSSCGKLSLLHV